MDEDANVLEEGTADVYAEDLCVRQFLRPLRPFLDHGKVTEVCVNEPGRVHVESSDGWHCLDVPQMSYERCLALATAVATFGDQRLSEGAPLLSTTLPSGERIQIAVPPVTARSRVSITIRKPSAGVYTLAEFEAQGAFSRIPRCEAQERDEKSLLESDRQLLALLQRRCYQDFFRHAVQDKRTIVVAGDTGSGKTTFIKSLLHEVPRQERLITIEDAAEITLPDHPNKVHLYYSQGKQGVADVSATELLRACLRMKPNRIFLGELRGPEAWDFLNVCASGHPGGMSSVHAASCALTFERLAFLVGQSPAASTLRYEQIKRLLLLVVDIVVHIERVPGEGRFVRELYFDPARKLVEARI